MATQHKLNAYYLLLGWIDVLEDGISSGHYIEMKEKVSSPQIRTGKSGWKCRLIESWNELPCHKGVPCWLSLRTASLSIESYSAFTVRLCSKSVFPTMPTIHYTLNKSSLYLCVPGFLPPCFCSCYSCWNSLFIHQNLFCSLRYCCSNGPTAFKCSMIYFLPPSWHPPFSVTYYIPH